MAYNTNELLVFEMKTVPESVDIRTNRILTEFTADQLKIREYLIRKLC